MRETSAGSGSVLRTSGQLTVRVPVPTPSMRAPSPSSSWHIAWTSRMRGTFSSTHGSRVSRHAARIGSAAFLLPSTVTTPESA